MFRKRSCGCNQNNNDDNYMQTENTCMEIIECPYNQNYADNYMNCKCGYDQDNVFPNDYMFGNSYVPNHKMTEVFMPDVGLRMGTVFPELVSPYIPNQSTEVIEYLKNANEIGEGCNSGYGM